MTRIKGQLPGQAKRAMQVLGWITCAQRELKTVELQHGLAVEHDTTELDPDNIPQLDHLVSICAGLVTINEQAGTVRLVHYTTQEYLKSAQNSWFPNIQTELMRSCTTYLSYKAFEKGHCHTREEYKQRLSAHPFLLYSGNWWGYHASKAERGETILKFLRNRSSFQTAQQAHKWYWSDTKSGGNALHAAARFGLEETILPLLQEYDTEGKTHSSNTPLLLSCEYQHWDVARLLIYNGADVNAANDRRETPLLLAAGDTATAKLLLERGARADCVASNGATPLTRSIHNFELTDLLLRKGAKLNTSNALGIDPLRIALRAETPKRDIRTIKLLMKYDARLISDNIFELPLAIACQYDYVAAAELLIKHDAFLNAKLDSRHFGFFNKSTPPHLDLVIKHSGDHDWDLTLVRLLITKGVNLNSRGPISAMTPLVYLSTLPNFSQEAASLFIKNGADVNSEDRYGNVLLNDAIKGNDIRIATRIVELGADVNIRTIKGTPLTLATSFSSLEMVTLLVKHGADVNLRTIKGETPLTLAALRGNLQMVRLLIRHGADVHVRTTIKRETTLHCAILGQDVEVAKLLLDSGTDVNSQSINEDTPLHYAAACGYSEMVELLVKNGGDVSAQTAEGYTPLHCTLGYGCGDLEMAKFLVGQGANVNLATARGDTPLSLARRRGNQELCDLFTNADPGTGVSQGSHSWDNCGG